MRVGLLCFVAVFASCATSRAPRAVEPTDPVGPPGEWYPPPPAPSLGTADVMEAVLSQKLALARCVTQQRQVAPDARGRALLSWDVRLSGEAQNVEVTDAPEPLATCLRGAVAAMRTRPHTVPYTERITFPFRY